MNILKFPQNLEYLLKSRCMSQQKLADILGTTQATINRWVKGINQPDFMDLILISIIFDETIDYLLGKEDLSYDDIAAIKNSLLSKK